MSLQPPGLSTLCQGERLLLRTARALALDIRCQGFQTQFEQACGCAGPEAFRALAVFVAQIGLKGRRRLAVGLPGADTVTADEVLLLEIFASAQAEDYWALDGALGELLARQPQSPLGAAACLVAQALAMNGLLLSPPAAGAGWAGAPIRSAASPPAV